MTAEDPYLAPGGVLRNKLSITDAATLDVKERVLVTQRMSEGAPFGAFDLRHLRAIHRHLFQDVYDWAGELRTVEISKDGHQFQFARFIETGMADIHRRLSQANLLVGLDKRAFAAATAAILGDVNCVHPFRDGNGGSQLEYLRQLAEHAGHRVELMKLSPVQWIAASRAAHDGDYALMAAAIESIIAA